jgi:hypothetical protein
MIWFLDTFSSLNTVNKKMTVAIGVMALAIPEKAEETWCPPKAKRVNGIAVLISPTIKLSIKNFISLRILILLMRRTR